MKTAVTVGTFDGFHLGHRDLVHRLAGLAAERGLEPLAVTFRDHPLATLRPEAVPPLLAPRPPRVADWPVDRVEILDFDRRLAAMPAGEFMDFLIERYDAALLLTGHDNRLGSDGPADPQRYAALGRERGLEVLTAPRLVLPDGGVPASSAIRRCLAQGDVSRAADLLGAPYDLEGPTVPGRQNGRRLGFPTLNIAVDPRRMVPAPGVYATRVTIDGNTYPAVTNIGHNPSVSEGNPLTIETHAIDAGLPYDYGREVRVAFVRRLRDERRFPSLTDLRAAIAADITSARIILG